MMNELNRYYGRVAAHLQEAGVSGAADWEAKHGQLTMPPPATMTIDLGQQISARSETGMQVRLYSDYPFKRPALAPPPPDEFEQEAALNQLRRDPTRPYYRFENLDGRPVLRYATARVMETGCVSCHNNHRDRSDNWPEWKEGDVRGVLEIIRPLDQDQLEHPSTGDCGAPSSSWRRSGAELTRLVGPPHLPRQPPDPRRPTPAGAPRNRSEGSTRSRTRRR